MLANADMQTIAQPEATAVCVLTLLDQLLNPLLQTKNPTVRDKLSQYPRYSQSGLEDPLNTPTNRVLSNPYMFICV